jgi:hypothetical protein
VEEQDRRRREGERSDLTAGLGHALAEPEPEEVTMPPEPAAEEPLAQAAGGYSVGHGWLSLHGLSS